MVRHLIDVRNTRFMYTTKVHETINHHLVKGFSYNRFRKTDYIDVEQQNQKRRDFLERFKQDQEMSHVQDEGNDTHARNYNGKSMKNLHKQAFLALRLLNPQLNCQNENTKSQVLMTSKNATAVIFHYLEPNHFKINDHFLKIKAGRLEDTAVKREINVAVQ